MGRVRGGVFLSGREGVGSFCQDRLTDYITGFVVLLLMFILDCLLQVIIREVTFIV